MSLDRLNTHQQCPRCRGDEFHIGPRGGVAVNIKCARCGEKYWFCPPFLPVAIDNADQVYPEATVRLRDYVASRSDLPRSTDGGE